MTIQIMDLVRGDGRLSIGATVGKVSGVVCIGPHGVDVLCCNAAHRAWRGGGRFFGSISDALGAYKSPEMRAIIQEADKLNA